MDEEINSKEKKGKGSVLWSLAKIMVVVAITAVVTHYCTIKLTIKSYLNKIDTTYMTTKMVIINDKLKDTYIYDLNDEAMIEGAIKGYVAGVGDKYTCYYTKEEMESFKEATTGSYVGIGVYMANNTSNNTVTIIGVIEGSSAEKAGLKAGDIIHKVDDVEYTGEELEKVSAAIKGEVGTEIKVTIIRDEKTMDFMIERANVKIKSVGSTMLDDGIAYIEIASFNEGTANEFRTAYEDVRKNNPKGLIIDLRDNGGGLVNESLSIAETMVEKGKNLLIVRDKSKNEKVTKSEQNPIVDIPVVVLINNNTASSSEILAGCLKENCNYKVIGETSYGKGVIQAVVDFNDGSGLKVTVEEYFTPNHNSINGIGIVPDIEVSLDEKWKNISSVPYEDDLQLQKAVEVLKY